jgi:hypothetical protein
MQVAVQFTKYNALESHAKDELGINEFTQPKPLQAALASGASFISGGFLPPFGFLVCSSKQYGYLPIFLFNCISCIVRCNCCKGRWLKYYKRNNKDLLLEYNSNGYNSLCWLSVRSKDWVIKQKSL